MERQTIRHHRIAAGLTQRQLAARLGISPMAVSYWETGRREPNARQLKGVADVLGVSMDAIAFEREAAQAEILSPYMPGTAEDRTWRGRRKQAQGESR